MEESRVLLRGWDEESRDVGAHIPRCRNRHPDITPCLDIINQTVRKCITLLQKDLLDASFLHSNFSRHA